MNDWITAILVAPPLVFGFLWVVTALTPKPKWDILYGYCKECKKPMYVPTNWYTSTPPPVKKTCFGDKPTNGNHTDSSVFDGHDGLPVLAGDEYGLPLNHRVNRGRFSREQEKEVINRYSFNFTKTLDA